MAVHRRANSGLHRGAVFVVYAVQNIVVGHFIVAGNIEAAAKAEFRNSASAEKNVRKPTATAARTAGRFNGSSATFFSSTMAAGGRLFGLNLRPFRSRLVMVSLTSPRRQLEIDAQVFDLSCSNDTGLLRPALKPLHLRRHLVGIGGPSAGSLQIRRADPVVAVCVLAFCSRREP